MLPLKRQEPHPSHDAVARDLLEALRDEVLQGKQASFANREMWTLSYMPKSSVWKASWGPREAGLYKRALVGADGLSQRAKCVWCEQRRSWKGELHVDHLRPKGVVSTWEGEPPEISDEPPREVFVQQPGYWWLAYTWSNWNLACVGCNAHWKRCLLPRAPAPHCHIEGVEQHETLHLLDPTQDFRTRDHFQWDFLGYMHSKSPVGRATIITCGLNRRELVAARLSKVPDVQRAIEHFEAALASGHDDAMDREARRLAQLGAAHAEFAGMVRDLVETRFGEPWESLPFG